jgi:hypothetical protein
MATIIGLESVTGTGLLEDEVNLVRSSSLLGTSLKLCTLLTEIKS